MIFIVDQLYKRYKDRKSLPGKEQKAVEIALELYSQLTGGYDSVTEIFSSDPRSPIVVWTDSLESSQFILNYDLLERDKKSKRFLSHLMGRNPLQLIKKSGRFLLLKKVNPDALKILEDKGIFYKIYNDKIFYNVSVDKSPYRQLYPASTLVTQTEINKSKKLQKFKFPYFFYATYAEYNEDNLHWFLGSKRYKPIPNKIEVELTTNRDFGSKYGLIFQRNLNENANTSLGILAIKERGNLHLSKEAPKELYINLSTKKGYSFIILALLIIAERSDGNIDKSQRELKNTLKEYMSKFKMIQSHSFRKSITSIINSQRINNSFSTLLKKTFTSTRTTFQLNKRVNL